MKRVFLSIIAAASMFVGCNADADVEVIRPIKVDAPTFSASFDAETRTSYEENQGYAKWIENEHLSIFNLDNHNLKYYIHNVGNNGKTADMDYAEEYVENSGAILDQNYAIYPYSEVNEVANGIIYSEIPALQTYDAESNFKNVPIVACSPDTSLSFSIPTAIYRYKVKKQNHPSKFYLKSITMTSKSKNIAGAIEIKMTAEKPVAVVTGDGKSVTLDLGENGVEITTTEQDFYIALPAISFPENDRTITCLVSKGGKDYQVVIEKDKTMELEAGIVKSTSIELKATSFTANSVYPSTGGELVGNLTLTSDFTLTQPLTVPAGEEATLNLNGHTITNKVENTSTDVIIIEEGAKLTINGKGNVTAVSGNDGYPIVCYGELTINDGVFTSGADANGDANACIYAKANGQITITGGEFESADGSYVLNLHDGSRESASITVKGGKFHNFDPANNASEGPGTRFVAEGYISVETSEGVWEVFRATESVEVASAAALEDVLAQGGKATLAANIVLEKSLTVTKDATLNLNDKEITCKISDVLVVTNGTLTINGDGVVYGSSDDSSSACAVWAKESGNVVINGGTFMVGDDESSKASGNWRNDCIYARDNATITINGGTFKYTGKNEEGHKFLLNLLDDTPASIVVNGGEFYNFDPANNSAEGPGTSFVAEGYASVMTTDNVYKVIPVDKAYNTPNAVITLAAGTYTLPTEFADGVTLNCQEGVIFNGQSSLDINGAKIVGAKFANTDEKGKVATGIINGEFVDCVFEGDYALRNMKLGEKASFDGCEFIGRVYGVHFDGVTTSNTELVFNNCDFTGWNSFGTAITKVTMTGCRFHHSGTDGYGRLRFYQNAVVSNSTFDETYDGIDFGDLGNGQGGLESTFTGCAWTNKNIVDLFVFTGLDTVLIDGKTYPVVANTAEAVVEALANGDVVANATISVASELDGNGNTLFIDNELSSNHIITASNNATIENLNIEGGNIRTTDNKATYALYFTGGNIVVDNVSVNEVAYTINYQRTSTTATDFTLTVSNSTLTGWTSWGVIDWAKFTNVHFGIGTYYEKGNIFCGGMRPYATTTLENCTFDKNFGISTNKLSESVTITMKNCKVDGVVLTKDNWMSYLKVEGENTAFVLFE